MSEDYLPTNDGELRLFATVFARTLTTDPTVYGMTAGDAVILTDVANAFTAAMAEVNALQAATSAAVANKNALRAAMKGAIRPRAAQIQANPGVTGALLEAAGLPMHDNKPSHSAPLPPSLLSCTPLSNGFNALSWHRNGNRPKTMFDIEAKRGTATEFTHVYTVTATKYIDPSPAGAAVMYRVRARRNKAVSHPSNETGVS